MVHTYLPVRPQIATLEPGSIFSSNPSMIGGMELLAPVSHNMNRDLNSSGNVRVRNGDILKVDRSVSRPAWRWFLSLTVF